ncbi:MAG: flagellar hook-associated protein FlgK [Gammaproteobacteria bacterium]|nr:flagellar hook-associated protein FlgK [Gammaproteobacteria bacterium]MBU1776355.1 flagellar hook-associated protein FlgK [Gammaproteobacteria bacterium]MBU1968207.1 flagellar hook-associated protein FlgK [Gammaproteobacteria bacterium]
MGSGIYNIGVSALRAAQAGMTVTSHNIANANTPGFTRQEIVQTAMLPQNTGNGFFGQGANVTNVIRRYDQFLSGQVLEAQTRSSNLATQSDLAQQLSNLLGDSSGGLTPTLQDFFGAVNEVANSPESVAARQTLLGSAQSLVNRLQTLDGRMNEIRDDLNGQISESVSQINSYAKQIAALNDTIVKMQAQTPGQPPNDLLDQRDQLINELSKEIRVSTISHPDGTLDVFIGSGQTLVIGNQTATLQTRASATDPSALEVVYFNNNKVSAIPEGSLQGGQLGGYLNFRSEVLDPAVNTLGRIAISLADIFNQQNQQGLDLKGALGGDMFTMAAPRVTASTNNIGNSVLTATISSTSELTAEDFSIKFDGTSYNVVNLTSGNTIQSYTAAQLAAGQTVPGIGLTLQLTAGSIADVAGDSFLVRPTVDAATNIALAITDPNKIAAASPVRSGASLANMGNATISAPTVNGLPLDANLQQPITITFTNATTYTVSGTGAPVGPQAYTAGADIVINGWTVKIDGTPVANDSFTVGANTNASTDGSNALLMAALQTANTMLNGTTSVQGAYGQLVSQIGTQTRELSVTSKAQDSMLKQITAAQQSASGVNLDEEAANLMKYQQAYQAAAKAMQIAQSMFESLLQLGG